MAPGQPKDDPNHGFRVCVNALINKCLKPCASTIPLATDEIRKLFNCKYSLPLDGESAQGKSERLNPNRLRNADS